MQTSVGTNVESLLRENRVFPPPAEFAAKARVGSVEEYEAMYRRSVEEPEAFWAEAAGELEWFAPWEKVLEGEMGSARWFVGGKLNLSHNCVDRHAAGARREKTALLWEGEPGEVRRISYGELHTLVQRFANVLKGLGVKRGDRVAIYMGMGPELAVAMLACARIGAVHSVIFGGFAAQAIVDRVNDSQCVLLLTQDVSYRRGVEVGLKAIVDEAIDRCPTVRNVVVYQRAGKGSKSAGMKEGRDLWWHYLMAAAEDECDAEWMDAEDLLYILYTSGTTGKPKGLVHTTGGYAVQSYLTAKYVFDLREDDVYWCTADCGWVTGHSYVVYGPLLNGATVLMYEGAPNFPANDRFWKIIDDHKVTIFYTAPTAIRAFIKWGEAVIPAEVEGPPHLNSAPTDHSTTVLPSLQAAASPKRNRPASLRGDAGRLHIESSQPTLEVVRHAQRRHGEDLIAVCYDVGLAEGRRLHQQAPVLDANVEARAQLIRQPAAKQSRQTLRPLAAQLFRPIVQHRRKDQRAASNLQKGVIPLEGHAEDIRARALLHPRVEPVAVVIGQARNHRCARNASSADAILLVVLDEAVVHL